jgi:hypothetical protein
MSNQFRRIDFEISDVRDEVAQSSSSSSSSLHGLVESPVPASSVVVSPSSSWSIYVSFSGWLIFVCP